MEDTDINWRMLYDKLSAQYNQLDTSFREQQKQLHRIETEVGESTRRKVVEQSLDIFDDVHRLYAEVGKESVAGPLMHAIDLIRKNFLSFLERQGVLVVPAAQGTPFDPAVHEAMAVCASTTLAPNSIIEVVRTGFLYNNTLLRPARVLVSGGT